MSKRTEPDGGQQAGHEGGGQRFHLPLSGLVRRDPDDLALETSLPPAATEPEEPELTPSSSLQYVAFEPKRLRRAVVLVLLLFVALQFATWAFESVGHFLFLILLAWLLAIAMEPSVSFFARRGFRRGFGTGVTLLGLVLAVVALLGLFGGLFFTQLAGLVQALPTLVVDIVAWLNSTFSLNLDPNEITDRLNLTAGEITGIASNLAGGVFGIVGSLVGVLFDTLTVLVFSFYIAADGPRLRRTIGSWLPPARQRVFVTVWDIAIEKTGGFVVSKVILATLSAFFHSVFFAVINIPYWLPMGVFAGIVSQFIPTIGTYIGVAIPAVFAAFDDPLDVLWIVLFATVYQQVENYVFTPKVSRATMDIHPALALASVFIGAAFFGPIGAIIGIPLAAAIIAVVDTYGQRYELVPELSEHAAPTRRDGARTRDGGEQRGGGRSDAAPPTG
ncbi:MAG: AI-2E family transporter [Candidatus Nanopelagicales bacterium]